jgi:hypothetical protein
MVSHFFRILRFCTLMVFMGLSCFELFPQAPEAFRYQAVVRSSNGSPVANQNVRFRTGVWRTDPISGTNVFTETHLITTDQFGIAHLSIGAGSLVSGSFSAIDWSNGPYFVKVELDPAGGTSYQLMGASQLLSVPFALYAKSAGNADGSETKINSGTAVNVTGSGTQASPYVVNSTLDGSETRINAGTSVSVTGSGTTGSPYVINASPDGSETKVNAGSLISVSGSGTSVSPYLVSSTVNGSETKFNAGNLISVTGSGTVASPYVVNFTADGSETKVSSGTNVTVTGSGTVASPYVINASPDGSETKISAGSKISVSGFGTSASPYTINSTVNGSETVINAGTNISRSGSGTSANPYVISSALTGNETKVTAGNYVTVTGSGTSGVPYVINSLGAPIDHSIQVQLFDDFVGGGMIINNTSRLTVSQPQEGLGSLGWILNWGNVSSSAAPQFNASAGVSPNFGVFELGLDISPDGYTSLYLPNVARGNTPGYTIEFLVKQGTLGTSGSPSNFIQRIGLMSSFTTTSGEPTDGVYFRQSANGNWIAVCRSGGTETAITTVTQTTSYRKFKISTNSTGTIVSFYTDGVLRSTINTNIPTSSLGVGYQVEAVNISGAKWFYMDYFQMSVTGISR